MKDNIMNAQRWLRQAEHDIERATRDMDEAFYSDCCFMAEQASQKALKAYLFFKGERFVNIHALVKLVDAATQKDGSFAALKDAARILDKYYIPTRYPDALPAPAVPFEAYDKEDAADALECAKKIAGLAKEKIRE